MDKIAADSPAQPDCQGSLHPSALEGFALFNQRKYWHAHEALELAWKAEPGEVRKLYQGILQAGVTYLHIQRGNYAGALKVYLRARRWLNLFPGRCRGVEVERLRQDLDLAVAELKRLGPEHTADFDPALLRPLIYELPAGTP